MDVAALSGSGLLGYRGLAALLEIASSELKVSDFGLRLARAQRGGKVIGPVGIAMKNSETVGQALGYCARHIHAYSRATRVRFKPDRTRHNVLLYLEVFLERPVDMRQAVEHAIALASLNISDISSRAAQVREIWFRHEALHPLRNYRKFFGCEVLFGKDRDGFILNEADLVCPIAAPDEQILEMATDFIEARFPAALPPVQSQVRNAIQRNLHTGECTFQKVAEELCMHPRTLQRRLRGEGVSYETVRDEVRRELALRLLRQNSLSLTEVAHKIGYAETSVLSRSCQRWFGATPEQVRRAATAESVEAN